MGMHQGSVLSPFPSALVVDDVTEFARGKLNFKKTKHFLFALSELLYADDLVQMSETIEGLRNKKFYMLKM